MTQSRPGREGWTPSSLLLPLCPACTPQTPQRALCASSTLLEGERWPQSRGSAPLSAFVLLIAARSKPRKQHLPSSGDRCCGDKDGTSIDA